MILDFLPNIAVALKTSSDLVLASLVYKVFFHSSPSGILQGSASYTPVPSTSEAAYSFLESSPSPSLVCTNPTSLPRKTQLKWCLCHAAFPHPCSQVSLFIKFPKYPFWCFSHGKVISISCISVILYFCLLP